MGWNYVATFNGAGSISYLPTGTVDESDNLWVMWADAGQDRALSYFSQPIPEHGGSFSVHPTRLPERTAASPCLICVNGKLVTLWLKVPDDSMCRGVLDPKAGCLDLIDTWFSYQSDGTLAAFFPGADSLFFTFRGNHAYEAHGGRPDNTDLYYVNVIGRHEPGPNNRFSYAASNAYQSYYTPAVAAMPDKAMPDEKIEEVAVLWKGIGRPGDLNSDNNLYFVSAPNPVNPMFPAVASPLQYRGPGGTSLPATCMNRPSLALHGKGPTPTLVAVYPSTVPDTTSSRQLSYLVGTPNGGGVTWAAPSPKGAVPLRELLRNAGANEGAVELTNPVGVWVTAPKRSDDLYLLVGDQTEVDVTPGPLYLVRYSGG